MTAFSPEKFDVLKAFHIIFPEKEYDISIEDPNFVLIKEKKEGKAFRIIFPRDEVDVELKELKQFGPYVCVGDDFLNCLLYDSKKTLRKEIKLEQGIKGAIINDLAGYYAVIILNLRRNIIDLTKIKYESDNELKDLLQNEIVLLDITNYNETIPVQKWINSVLAYLAYSDNIKLTNPENFYNTPETPQKIDTLISKTISNDELIDYFLLAENVTYPHLKYLEYYHVIEYYFLENTKDKINRIIRQIITKTLIDQKNIDETDYFTETQGLLNKFQTREDFVEQEQIKDVISNSIGENIIGCCKKIGDIKFLSSKIFDDKETEVDISKIYNSAKNEYIENPEKSSIEAFSNLLSRRIYKIRNYLVHTKKGEKPIIFTPNNENFAKLSNDVMLIRHLAFYILIK